MPTITSSNGCRIIISGRCGISFYDENNNEFYIDSEMVNSIDYDMYISRTGIWKKNDKIIIPLNKKEEILNIVLELCKQGGIKVKVD